MRFMVLIKSDAQTEAGVLPDQKLLTDMGKYNEELVKAGVMLGGEGLKASSKGSRVRLSGKKFSVTDGPFAEAKELVAGFWLFQVKSKNEALEWVKRVPVSAAPGAQTEIEIRELFELTDFPPDPAEHAGGWREQEQELRDQAAAASAKPARKPGTKRFMVMLRGDKHTESDQLPDQKTLAKMGALMEELAKSGTLLAGEGLKPSSKGARVKFSGAKPSVIDGPFTETKELIAGYCMIQVKSKAEAIEFAKRWLEIHAEMARDESVIDVRELFELDDLPVDSTEKPDGWRAQEARMRAELERQ
jgi:hypothetical protein